MSERNADFQVVKFFFVKIFGSKVNALEWKDTQSEKYS